MSENSETPDEQSFRSGELRMLGVDIWRSGGMEFWRFEVPWSSGDLEFWIGHLAVWSSGKLEFRHFEVLHLQKSIVFEVRSS